MDKFVYEYIEDNIDSWKRWKYAKNFLTLDLLTMLYSKALRVSLKEMQVTMMYKNVQEFNCDWQSPLALQEIDNMINLPKELFDLSLFQNGLFKELLLNNPNLDPNLFTLVYKKRINIINLFLHKKKDR